MHGGDEQNPSTKAITWYGVQQITNAPNINEIVRNAFLARFSDLDFCRPPIPRLPNGFLPFPFSLLPIERMKSRFFSESLAVAATTDLPFNEEFDVFTSTVVPIAVAAFEDWDGGALFEMEELNVPLLEVILSVISRSVISSRFDFCAFNVFTIEVTGRSGFCDTLTVVLNLFIVSTFWFALGGDVG